MRCGIGGGRPKVIDVGGGPGSSVVDSSWNIHVVFRRSE